MKHKLMIILLAVVAVLSCSCGQESTQKPQRPNKPLLEKNTSSVLNNGEMETGTVPGDYVYRVIDNRVLIKYHIPTGTANFVCPDPFCNHNRDINCPFNVSPAFMASIGNMLYYSVKIDEQWHLRSYDGDSMKYEEIRTSNGVLSRLFSYNYYLYFSESESADGNMINSVVYRWDTQSGAFDVIDCGYPGAKIYKIEAGRIVWERGVKYFSTDLSGEDEREYTPILQREWGQDVYRWTLDSNGGTAYLYRKDLSTNKEIVVAQNIERCYFYGDKVIYFKRTETSRKISTETGMTIIDEWGGNVYIVNSDGTDNHLLCHVEDFYYAGTSSDRNNEWVCGDWVGLQSQNYYLDSSGQVHWSITDTLFVNVVTGEYKFIKFNHFE